MTWVLSQSGTLYVMHGGISSCSTPESGRYADFTIQVEISANMLQQRGCSQAAMHARSCPVSDTCLLTFHIPDQGPMHVCFWRVHAVVECWSNLCVRMAVVQHRLSREDGSESLRLRHPYAECVSWRMGAPLLLGMRSWCLCALFGTEHLDFRA